MLVNFDQIRKDLEENNINVYPNVANHDVDEEEMAANEPLMVRLPVFEIARPLY